MSQEIQPGQGYAALGKLTGAALDDTDSLFLPYQADAFGTLRRGLGLAGLKLSFELARMAYTLDVEPWMRAGWTDFSIQVDNQLTTDMTSREDESFAERRLSMLGSLKLTRARRALKENNPLARVTGALRQREESDTLKAVVMIHPAAEGRYIVAIGFMGTGARFYDWFSNLRLSTEEGFHKGFYQLTEAFLKNETEILFPDTAEAMGLKSLTLADILAEMRQADSRFSLWMAGHSQGAAVMQVYCDRLLRDKRIPPERIIGCGLASPTVAADGSIPDTPAYPLYHVLNSDDLVPRMGSLKHFGLCLQYTPDEKFRETAYGWSREPDACRARRDARRMTFYITDTPSFLAAFSALLDVICEENTDDAIFGVSEGLLSFGPLDKVFSFAGKKAKATLHSMIAYMHKSYHEITGAPLSENVTDFLKENCRPIVRATPLKRLLGELFDCLYPPHSLYNNTENGSYWHIVTDQATRLRPFTWRDDPGGLPYRRYARGYFALYGQPRRQPNARRTAGRKRTRTRPRRRAIQKLR